MDRKLKGSPLTGFADFFEGGHELVGAQRHEFAPSGSKPTVYAPGKSGAHRQDQHQFHPSALHLFGAPPPSAPVKGIPGGKQMGSGSKTQPVKTIPYPKPKQNPAVSQHAQVLDKAHAVIAKATNSVQKAVATLGTSKFNKPRSLAAHIGAVAPAVAAVLPAKAQAAIKKHDAAVAKAAAAATKLAQASLAAKGTIAKLATAMVKQKKTAIAMRAPKGGGTHVGELMNDPVIGAAAEEAFNSYYDMIGADPDPNNPGFLTDGSPDPAFATIDATAAATSTTADTAAGNAVDSGQLPDPSAFPPGSFIADLTQLGAVMYDGSKGKPNGYALSYGLATRKTDRYVEPDTVAIDGHEHHGYVWGTYDWKDPNMNNSGIPWGTQDNLAPKTWNRIHGRYHLGEGGWTTSGISPSEVLGWANTPDGEQKNHDGVGYGPIVGNPRMPDFAAMRSDAKGNLGWLPQEAPAWLTFPLKQAAALTAQAAAKAAADAAAADAAAQAKAAADAAAAQAQQDAQNALSESAATSQAKVSAAQAEAAQAPIETQAQQALVQQQQVETAQQQQAGDIMVQQAQQMMAQQPLEEGGDEEEATGDEGGGDFEPPMPGTEGGGGEGTFDDGLPIPGADVMLDQDGEGAE